MVRAVATTTPDATVEKVARLMINLRISGVPVLDRNGQLVGIVTEGDLLRRAETASCISGGTVGSEEERRALRVVAENVPGVRGIEDHTSRAPRYLSPLFPAA